MSEVKNVVKIPRIVRGIILKDRITHRWGVISSASYLDSHIKIRLPRVALRNGIVEVGLNVQTTFLIPADAEKFHKFDEGVYCYMGDGCNILFIPATSKKRKEYKKRWKRIFS